MFPMSPKLLLSVLVLSSLSIVHSLPHQPPPILAQQPPTLSNLDLDDFNNNNNNNDDLRLLSFGDDQDPVWMTEDDKISLKAQGKGFMDITDYPTLGLSRFLSPSGPLRYTYPSPDPSSNLSALFPALSTTVMRTNLEHFTSFRTRYYKSQTGKDSQAWLFGKVKEYAAKNSAVKVTEFQHPWGQNSIIAHIPSSSNTSKSNPISIISAHQDSTNMFPFLPAPGADDDGSGTTSILEAFRVLTEKEWTPTEGAVEFHWYSAEEGGLLGSQAVARDYESREVDVKGMIQMDMTAWVKKGTEEVVGVVTDFVDPELTKFIMELVGTYLDIPAVPTKCGYACSDHASWSKAGYQSAFSIESTFEDSNHNIHSTSDTIDHPEFSFDHMKEFSKLAIAFAGELGGM